MSYPTEAAGQGLYEVATSPKNELGAIAHFTDSNGAIYARYMKNDAGATLAAGNLVSYEGTGMGHIGGIFATNSPIPMLAGGLATSLATDEYGWVIFQGVQTNVSASATQNSATLERCVIPNGGGVTTAAITVTQASLPQHAYIGIIGTQIVSTGAVNTITWLWK